MDENEVKQEAVEEIVETAKEEVVEAHRVVNEALNLAKKYKERPQNK